jgi:23S rRNA (guanosine2251-2'-O)-methyltransferase
MKKLKAKQLRVSEPSEKELKKIKHNPIYFVLDEILDTFNIGSMFRLADAVAADRMFLCGKMEFPPQHRIHKAAVGTESWVSWEKRDSTVEVIKELKSKGVMCVAIEQDRRSIPYWELKPNYPIALVVGHETKGVSHEVLAKVDKIVELPMFGVNISFNVWGSAAVVAYSIVQELF